MCVAVGEGVGDGVGEGVSVGAAVGEIVGEDVAVAVCVTVYVAKAEALVELSDGSVGVCVETVGGSEVDVAAVWQLVTTIPIATNRITHLLAGLSDCLFIRHSVDRRFVFVQDCTRFGEKRKRNGRGVTTLGERLFSFFSPHPSSRGVRIVADETRSPQTHQPSHQGGQQQSQHPGPQIAGTVRDPADDGGRGSVA